LTVRALAVLGLALVAAAATGAGSGPSFHADEVTAAALPQSRTPASASATWCGSPSAVDRAPNVVAGHPVHWIYAIPSDGPDRFSTYASLMQTDAEAIDVWWRREDPLRTPRNDLTRLACGTQLDLTSLRLELAGAQLEGGSSFQRIFTAIAQNGFASEVTKYVVYYDGPVSAQNAEVCGRGGGDDDGIGLAVVYVRSCVGASTAAIVAHEILHTLGAVPFGAPNDCGGHVCGNPSDLMNPTIAGLTLEQKVLDAGRDDYYGHAAAHLDTQDAPWLVQLDRQVPLRVNVTGPGRVSADLPGLVCARSCTTTWNAGTRLALSATPSAASKLVRWSGACRATGPCGVAVAPGGTKPATVSALFAPRVFELAVGVAGKGSVRTAGRPAACRQRCSASLPSYVPVRLTAAPAKGWKLRSWTGACRGNKRTCTVPMSRRTRARAVFVRLPQRAR
jgi:hypothetical protein